MRVELFAEARADLMEAWQFYEKQSAGLGTKFLDSIFADIDTLPNCAGIHRVVNGSHRHLATKFPFAIYYRIENRVIRVRAVLDCRRDPHWIKGRLTR